MVKAPDLMAQLYWKFCILLKIFNQPAVISLRESRYAPVPISKWWSRDHRSCESDQPTLRNKHHPTMFDVESEPRLE